MASQADSPKDVVRRIIHYLSDPAPEIMGDWWFDIATEDHFWIRRRFEVMRHLADSVIVRAMHCAEISCGNGLLQKELEDHYSISVAGFDLNEGALKKNVSRYRVAQRAAEGTSGLSQRVRYYECCESDLSTSTERVEHWRSRH